MNEQLKMSTADGDVKYFKEPLLQFFFRIKGYGFSINTDSPVYYSEHYGYRKPLFRWRGFVIDVLEPLNKVARRVYSKTE